MSKQKEQVMSVRILPNTTSNPPTDRSTTPPTVRRPACSAASCSGTATSAPPPCPWICSCFARCARITSSGDFTMSPAFGAGTLVRRFTTPGPTLWRMCFALFIAAGSFFSIRARVAKNPSGAAHDCADTRAGDPAVVCAMFFWLWRSAAAARCPCSADMIRSHSSRARHEVARPDRRPGALRDHRS
jgi:hypothetical protein